MINVPHFMEYVIRPALRALQLQSTAAEELLLGTALQESRLTYLVQLGNGPALGVFQMEPATHDDIWENFLVYKPALAKHLENMSVRRVAKAMPANMLYAAGMCRVHYYRRPEKLPAAGDIEAQAAYWKKHYNTHLGAGTVEEYLHNWRNQ